MLGREPWANTVSWMLPISQALQEGGIQAAYARYAELKNSNQDEYFFDEDELVTLVYQLVGAKKIDLAIDVLKLNIHAFPGYVGSYTFLARLYLQKGERAQAEEVLQKALAIEPDNQRVIELLKRARQL